MSNHLKFYIDGQWVDPQEPATIDVINPATEAAFTKISAGSAIDDLMGTRFGLGDGIGLPATALQ